MLQEIQLCTPAVAKSVMDTYPTLQSLHRAYERKEQTEGELLLANLEVYTYRNNLHIDLLIKKKLY